VGFVPLAAALALVWKLVDWAKALRVRDWNAVLTQLAVWVAGVFVIWLLASTDFAAGVKIGSMALSRLNFASLVLLGMSIGSSGSVAYDFKRAFDNTDSAAQPSLLPASTPASDGPPPTDAGAP
jgi:hypothetical protein